MKRTVLWAWSAMLLSIQAGLAGSSPADDLRKMQAFYEGKKNVYLEFSMNFQYINYPQNPVQKHSCLYTHSEKGSYSRVMERTVINTEKYTLQVDGQEKTAILSNYYKDGKEVPIQEIFGPMKQKAMDSTGMETYYKMSYKVNTPDKKTISITSKENNIWDYDHIEISLAKDYSLKEIVYYYKTEKSKDPQVASIVVTYTKADYAAHNEYFNLAGFVQISKKGVTATDKLKGYRIIDNRIKN